MKYDITYSCGHKGTVDLIGPGKDREKRIYYLEHSGLCPDCLAAETKRDRDRVAEESKEMELPDLDGSDKQVVWAAQIRREFIEFCQKQIDNVSGKLDLLPADKRDIVKARIQETYEAKDHILTTHRYARWWIDNRFQSSFIKEMNTTFAALKDMKASTEKKAEEDETATIVTPKEKKHESVVKITLENDTIRARYPRDEAFREVVVDLHFKWDKEAQTWSRTINKFSGPLSDRMAELGNRLLNAGFAIALADEELRRRAVAAEYTLEHRRWVTLYTGGEHKGKLGINWDRKDDLYAKIKSIHGAHWNGSSMVVPVESCDEVLDMADNLGFKISAGAQEAIDTYHSRLSHPVSVAPVPEKEEIPDKLNVLLESSREVLDDLKDDGNEIKD